MNHHDKQAKENALSSSMGCFMKGTLVKRPEGWTPIDELKVGDWVMSRPENGIGEAVPKRVVNTFSYEDKEVVMLKFSQFPERNGGGGTLVVTPNHPFCVYGVVTNLILEHPKFGKLGAYWKGCDYDSSDMFNGPDGWEKYDALSAFEKKTYEMRLYEQPVWKRADQLERGDVVLGYENDYKDYYVVEDFRPLYAYRDTDQAWIQPTNLAYGWKESDLGNSWVKNRGIARHWIGRTCRTMRTCYMWMRTDNGITAATAPQSTTLRLRITTPIASVINVSWYTTRIAAQSGAAGWTAWKSSTAGNHNAAVCNKGRLKTFGGFQTAFHAYSAIPIQSGNRPTPDGKYLLHNALIKVLEWPVPFVIKRV